MAAVPTSGVPCVRRDPRRTPATRQGGPPQRAGEKEHTVATARLVENAVDASALEIRLAAYLDALARHPWAAAGNRLGGLREETLEMAGQSAGIGSLPADVTEGDAQTIAEALVDICLAAAENAAMSAAWTCCRVLL